jgi:two-component system, NtrC family, sensor kinase
MVVDDDRGIRAALRNELSYEGFEVVDFADASTALQFVTAERVPCLALVDVMMPGMNGFDLCRRLQADHSTHSVPVVLITADIDPSNVEEGIACGASDYIKKPFDIDELRFRLRAQLRLHEAQIRERQTREQIDQRATDVRLNTVVQLSNISAGSVQEIAEFALEQGVALTGSEIGYLAFVNEDETILTMHAWSRNAMTQCRMQDKPIIYRLQETGLWGEAIRQRRPTITNDYNSPNPCKRGIPQGHIPLVRHMNVPIFDGSRIVAVAGVGNKRTDYGETDIHQLTVLMDGLWKMLHQRQLEDELVLARHELERRVSERTSELAQAEAFARDTVDALATHIAILDERGAIIAVNQAWRRFASENPPVKGNVCEGANYIDVCRQAREDEGARRFLLGLLSVIGSGTDLFEMEYPCHSPDCDRWFTARVTRFCGSGPMRVVVAHQDITKRKLAEQALRSSEERLKAIFDKLPIGVMIVGRDKRIRWASQTAVEMSEADDLNTLVGLSCGECACPDVECPILDLGVSLNHSERTFRSIRGNEIPILKSVIEVKIGGEDVLLETFIDISGRKQLEAELGHARKLEAVGQLAAGIAHEINTPTQYVGDSLHFLKESFEAFALLVARYRSAIQVLRRRESCDNLLPEIEKAEQELDLEYVLANVPGSFECCFDGVNRIANIVRAMKEFAHPDERQKSPADLNQALESTLTIARNEYKYVANLETDLTPLPPVVCVIGDLNQVFLNLIVNSAHAIEEVVRNTGARGRIRVSTCREGDDVRIDIADTGSGIPESIRGRVFDPFFTTKGVGKGSGQGLAIARSIVVDKHGGTLTFESAPGTGTVFTIRLPIDGQKAAPSEVSR